MSKETSPGAVSASGLPATWIAGGVLAVASLAAAAALTFRQDMAPVPVAPAAQAPAELVPARPAPAERAPDKTAASAAPAAAPAQARPAPAPRVAKVAAPETASPPVVACAQCGVVESVVAVKRKGEATGLGVVAGGVLGAVVGHQMGNGNGKKAMTVIGAVGGGVAGNEVEKRARGDTVYQVRVRMDDRSERTVEQAEAPQVGTRVQVQGGTLRALRNAG